MANGEGVRVVLWLSGCSHHCSQCQNPQTWSKDGGILFDSDALNEVLAELDKPYTTGLTLSGGDPMFLENREEVLNIVKQVKNKFPMKNIWMYTGYQLESLLGNEILQYVDVIIDGRFEQDKARKEIAYRGSTNQKIMTKQVKTGFVYWQDSTEEYDGIALG